MNAEAGWLLSEAEIEAAMPNLDGRWVDASELNGGLQGGETFEIAGNAVSSAQRPYVLAYRNGFIVIEREDGVDGAAARFRLSLGAGGNKMVGDRVTYLLDLPDDDPLEDEDSESVLFFEPCVILREEAARRLAA